MKTQKCLQKTVISKAFEPNIVSENTTKPTTVENQKIILAYEKVGLRGYKKNIRQPKFLEYKWFKTLIKKS